MPEGAAHRGAGELGFAGLNVFYNLLYLAIFNLPSTVSIRILPE